MAARQPRTAQRGALLGLAVLMALAGEAAAQDDDGLPAGKFGVSFGVRQGLGQLSEDYGLGMVGAAEAGYHRSSLDRSLSLGLSWSVVWGWFGADDQASIAGSLSVLEFNFGARVRRLVDEPSLRFLVAGSGVSLLRTNVPVPPDQERMYVGPYLTLGVEQFLEGKILVSFEARYGLLVGGPGSITIALGVGFGY